MSETSLSGKTNLFISYSRKDRGKIDELYAALENDEELNLFRDTDDILPSEEWKPRLAALIEGADTIIFALTPSSVTSQVCRWELEYAESLNKRIIPIVVEDVDGDVPEIVSKLNYIFLTGKEDFAKVLARLRSAISLDIGWIREHTRIGDMAKRWEAVARIGAQPLRGKELEAAENWLGTQPKDAPYPTKSHIDFILNSRKAETKRQRRVALTSLASLVVVGLLGVFAWVQRDAAIEARQVAERQTEIAKVEKDRALAAGVVANSKENEALTNLSVATLALEQPNDALRIALSAIPSQTESELDLPEGAIGSISRALQGQSLQHEAVFDAPIKDIKMVWGQRRALILFESGETKTLNLTTFAVDETPFAPLTDKSTSIATQPGSGIVAISDGTMVEIGSLTQSQERISVDAGMDILAMAFSPAQPLLAVVGWSGELVLFHTRSGVLIARVNAHTFFSHRVSFSKDGSKVATAGGDMSTIVWTLTPALAQLTKIQGGEGDFSDVNFSTSGGAIVTSSEFGKRQIWSLSSGNLAYEFDGRRTRIKTTNYTATAMIFSGLENGYIEFYSPYFDNFDLLPRSMRIKTGHNKLVSLSVDHQLNLAVTGGADGKVQVWDIKNAYHARRISRHKPFDWGQPLYQTAYLPKGEISVRAATNNSILIEGTAKTELNYYRQLGTAPYGVIKLEAYDDGSLLVLFDPAGPNTTSDDRRLDLHKIGESNTQVTAIFPDAAPVKDFAYCQSRNLVLGVSQDGSVAMASLGSANKKTNTRQIKLDFKFPYKVGFSNDCSLFYVIERGDADGQFVTKIGDTNNLGLFATLGENTDYIQGFALSPDNKTGFSTSSDKTVKIWDLAKETHQSIQLDRLTTGLAVSRNGKWLYFAAGTDIYLLHLASLEIVEKFSAIVNENVGELTLFEDENQLVYTLQGDGVTVVFDIPDLGDWSFFDYACHHLIATNQNHKPAGCQSGFSKVAPYN